MVEVAHDLISDHGLAWFSMRKLAAALDVNPMTVYLRFESKDELLAAVADRALGEFRLAEPPGDGPWTVRAMALATALRAHLRADRNLLGLYAAVGRMSSAVLYATEQGLALMEEVGYRGDAAVLAFRSLFWHTVGFVLVEHQFEQFPADADGGLGAHVGPVDTSSHPNLTRLLPSFTAVDGDALFAHSTHALVSGLAGAAPAQSERTP